MQLRKCQECGEGDAVMSRCVDCSRQLCRHCMSFAGQCARCMEKRERPVQMCGRCRTRAEDLGTECAFQHCILCRTPVCERCLSRPYANRPASVVCLNCHPPQQTLPKCGRCGGAVASEKDRYFCEVCADVICQECISASLECGVLKCRTCCPAPIRLLSEQLIRTVLDSALLNRIAAAVPQTQPSTYRKLSNRTKLGEGGQGMVYKCTTADGETVVSKEMTFPEQDRALFEARLYQAEKMRKLCHKHLIRYLDVIGLKKQQKICVIMPYYSEGDLAQFIRRQRRPIEEHRLCSLILQIAGALEYLHSQNPPLAHFDVKPENILLLSNEQQVLLMDLDLCGSFDVQASFSTRVLYEEREAAQTYEYRAPELGRPTASGGPAGSPKSDVFSLGVVAFQLAALPEFTMLRNSKGTTAVLNDSDWTKESLANAVMRAILQNTRVYPDALIKLINKMLEHDPAERPEAKSVRSILEQIMEERLLRGCN